MTQSAVILDLDGTLATFHPTLFQPDTSHDHPNQWSTYPTESNASVIEGIYQLAIQLQKFGEKVLLFSSQPASHRHACLDWMLCNNFMFDAIYYPSTQATKLSYEERKRSIMKRIEADGYKPWLVLDKEESNTTRSWRKLGLDWLRG